jgi:hypothetical protein
MNRAVLFRRREAETVNPLKPPKEKAKITLGGFSGGGGALRGVHGSRAAAILSLVLLVPVLRHGRRLLAPLLRPPRVSRDLVVCGPLGTKKGFYNVERGLFSGPRAVIDNNPCWDITLASCLPCLGLAKPYFLLFCFSFFHSEVRSTLNMFGL